MAVYSFHELTLEVKQEELEAEKPLAQLLDELSWMRTDALDGKPSLRLSISFHNNGIRVPSTAREIFTADGFRALESGEDFYLTDGASLFHFEGDTKHGRVFLASPFFAKPSLLQRNFWGFILMKLLRRFGIYSLHAAGLVTKQGVGILIPGQSGSGKSTLSLGLIRHGWRYLSDDAVLLRLEPEGVAALSCRKNFYVNAEAADDYADLPLGEYVPDVLGGQRCRIRIEETYPLQRVQACIPRLLLFPRIVHRTHSALLPLSPSSALRNLLGQSGPQLFDKKTMPRQLELLRRLLHQAQPYELEAGSDLYHEPAKLIGVLEQVRGKSVATACH